MFGVDDAPRHRSGAGTVVGNETGRECARLGIEDVIDVALAIDRDGLGLVSGHGRIAHALEQRCQFARPRMGKLDELETVGAGRVLPADFGGRCVVRKRAHKIHQSPTVLLFILRRNDRAGCAKFVLKCINMHDTVALVISNAMNVHG